MPEAPLFTAAAFSDRCSAVALEFTGPYGAALLQLHQWSMWRDERGSQWPALPEALRRRCRDKFAERSTRGIRPSRMQEDVSAAIRSIESVDKVHDEYCAILQGPDV